MITIVSSVEHPSFSYYNNLAFLRNGIQSDDIHFQGCVDNYSPPAFVFNKGSIYDFARTAKAELREDMTSWLCDTLPQEIQMQDRGRIREAFDCLFDYHKYKGYLTMVGQQRAESMEMLVFDQANLEYVAHVQFSSTATRTAPNQFTVDATLTCQRFTYFPPQEADLENVLAALQNLHV